MLIILFIASYQLVKSKHGPELKDSHPNSNENKIKKNMSPPETSQNAQHFCLGVDCVVDVE